MHILNVMNATNLGGMERTSLAMMRGFVKLGHSVSVLSVSPLGGLSRLLDDCSVPYCHFPYAGPYGLFSSVSVSRVMRGSDIDAVVFTGHSLVGSVAAAGISKPCVQAMHHYHFRVRSRLQWRIIYYLMKQSANWFTFPSDYLRDEACDIVPSLADKFVTVRNPIRKKSCRTESERALARQRCSIPESAFVIGNAGHLWANKRFDVLLDVFSRLHSIDSNIYCVIAGEGYCEAGLRRRAYELRVEKNVRWLGCVSDMESFYNCIDVLVFSSENEALGMTCIEAMSYGVPVVASILKGGLCEVVQHGASGFLFAEHDVDALAYAVCQIRDDAMLCRKIVEGGYSACKKLPTEVEYAKMYGKLLGVPCEG